jgi:cytochrome c oxidase cbb3-type subunit III
MAEEQKERSVISRETSIQFAIIFCSLAATAILLRAQDKPGTAASDAKAARRIEAQAAFESVCASCHGLDGRGTERGPDIVSRPDVVRKTDAELGKILKDGKAAEGMPSFASYGPAKLSALVAYLRTLQGCGRETPLPGDAVRGKILFFGKAKCAECHMVSGQGGNFARDLSAYATSMGPDEVRAVIVNPNRDLDPRRGLVKVILADSTVLSGVARNEDNFSLQLQTPDGVFHLLNKSDIRVLTYAGRSPMPSDYGSTLSSLELNDLVSYLLRASRPSESRKAKSDDDDGDEE